ncbi:MAG TPA: sigma-70 family RNA polymerase sigma factor [Holophagaceae bacterium]
MPEPSPTQLPDEALMQRVAAGDAEALQLLHQRHAPMVFHRARRSLDRSAAEEITQEVFLALWTRASTYDPARGPLRPWLLQVTHHLVANELRARSRRPQAGPDLVEDLSDLSASPEEEVWREYRRTAIREALRVLPPSQRQALALAFFDELSHEEVAHRLQVPLGTAKTRIRAGLQKLNAHLAVLVAVGLGLLLAVPAGLALRRAGRQDRALGMLTSSRAKVLRMEPSPPAADPEQALHAAWRSEPGNPTVVLTLAHFPPPPAGHRYAAWIAQDGSWRRIGTLAPDARGQARLVLEDPRFAQAPEGLCVTRDDARGPEAAIVAWPRRDPR